jgi:hypothetical protein
MKLAEMQRTFFAKISRPDPIADDRINVYGQMYFHRLLEVLEEDFPAVRATLGDEAFAQCAASYIEKSPSRHPALRHFGDRFPDHLSGALRDLARLERARTEAFDADDATPMKREAIASLVPAMPLHLMPSVRILKTTFDVEAAWLGADRKLEIPNMPASDRTLLVWRRGFVVAHRAIEGAEAVALQTVATNRTFAEVCEAFDDASSAASTLDQWIADEVLRS